MAIKQFVKFAFVGAICTLINYLSFLFCLNILHIDYIYASAIGYLIGLVINYFFNLRWTFAYQNASKKHVVKYFSVYAFSLFLGLFILKTLVKSFALDPKLANLIVIGITMLVNFFGLKFLVFN